MTHHLPLRYNLQELLISGHDSPMIAELRKVIIGNKLILYPTETIYGLGGIVSELVVDKMILAKKRSPDQPFIVIAGSLDTMTPYGFNFTKEAQILMDRFWPGNLTLISRCERIPAPVGLRVSDHPFIQIIDSTLSLPLYSTSANLSGTPYNGDPEALYTLFQDSVSIMIDAGFLPPSKPSTVVDVSEAGKIKIIREGAISAEAIRVVVGETI